MVAVHAENCLRWLRYMLEIACDLHAEKDLGWLETLAVLKNQPSLVSRNATTIQIEFPVPERRIGQLPYVPASP